MGITLLSSQYDLVPGMVKNSLRQAVYITYKESVAMAWALLGK
jgi:hypothetical protein